jgi:hypothetical protein
LNNPEAGGYMKKKMPWIKRVPWVFYVSLFPAFVVLAEAVWELILGRIKYDFFSLASFTVGTSMVMLVAFIAFLIFIYGVRLIIASILDSMGLSKRQKVLLLFVYFVAVSALMASPFWFSFSNFSCLIMGIIFKLSVCLSLSIMPLILFWGCLVYFRSE